jgi:hypothetical protein
MWAQEFGVGESKTARFDKSLAKGDLSDKDKAGKKPTKKEKAS